MRRGAFVLTFFLVLLVAGVALAGPVVQLTNSPATDWDPAWSPDGTEVAFGSDRNGDEVWAVNVQTLALRRVGGGSSPAWSPDGSKIVVEGMWILNSDGSGTPQPLPGGVQPAWSPDGGRIAFSDGDAICTVNVDGTGYTQVTFDDPGMFWYDSHPAWSPDGSEIAFVSDRGGDFAIWAVHPDGTGLRLVHAVSPGDWAAEPAWSPDGQWISFQYMGEVWATDLDGGNLRRITVGGGWDGTWSPDGARFAFTSDRSGNAEIWVCDSYQEPPPPLPPAPKTKVLFSACTPGRPYGPGLFVADADFSNPVRLTTPVPPLPGEEWLIETVHGCNLGFWSPDGSKVAFFQSGRLAVLDLQAVIQFPGQQASVLTDQYGQPIYCGVPCWSPASERIAYPAYDEATNEDVIRVINADGAGLRTLWATPSPGWWNVNRPTWSPDGSRIAFEIGPEGRQHIALLENVDDPGGPSFRQLTSDPDVNDMRPFWSPDGSRIAFTRSRAYAEYGWPYSDIWVADVSSGDITQISDTPDVLERAGGWGPLDDCIYFTEPGGVGRMRSDGTGRETIATDLPFSVLNNRFSWALTGVYIDGLNALPGEAVRAKMGIVDAENLAGVQTKIRYRGCCDTLSMYSADLGDSILDWIMPAPLIGYETASILAYAGDPETQAVSGSAHLFNLDLVNSPDAPPGATQLLSFDELLLSDDWGEPLARNALAGGVHTIPFAYLEVSEIAGPVCADPEEPIPFAVTVTALDRDLQVMAGCDASVELHLDTNWAEYPLMLLPVTPSSVSLVDGVWSGEVTVADPRSNARLLAHWEDIGGSSNWFNAIGRGDPSGDGQVSIFDVIKIANMAIGRGTWADWQLWAADLNGDGEINVFDVVICANKAMEAMQSLSVGRGAPVAAPAGPVTVTTTTTSTSTQTTVAVELSDCAGLAGAQVEIRYDPRKLSYASMSKGAVLNGKSSWAALDNELGGTVKAIAYTASGEVLSGGKGAILTFTFNRAGKAAAKVELTSVKLADAEGAEVACQVGRAKEGGKK